MGAAQSAKATVEQPSVDIDVVTYQLPKTGAKISQIPSGIKGFKQSDAAENL